MGFNSVFKGLIHEYRIVSFCDGSFYDDSLLRLLSLRTEHSRLVVHHCRNSSALSLLKFASGSFSGVHVFLIFLF